MTNHTPLRLIAKKAAAHTHTSMSKLSLYVQVFFSPSLSLFLAVFDALVCVFLCPYMLTVCESGKKKEKGEVSRLANIKHRAKKGCAKKQLIDKKKGRKKKSPDQTALRSSTNNCRRAAISCLINNQSGGIERETAKGLFVAGVNNKTSIKKKKKKKSPQTFSLLRLCFYLIHLFFSFFF